MKLPTIPKEACQQTITLSLKPTVTNPEDEDFYGKSVSVADIVITNCVVQMSATYSGTNNDRDVIANGSVYLVAGVTTPLPTLDKDSQGSTVTYEGKSYTVKAINEYKHPFSNDLWAYKLEIM